MTVAEALDALWWAMSEEIPYNSDNVHPCERMKYPIDLEFRVSVLTSDQILLLRRQDIPLELLTRIIFYHTDSSCIRRRNAAVRLAEDNINREGVVDILTSYVDTESSPMLKKYVHKLISGCEAGRGTGS